MFEARDITADELQNFYQAFPGDRTFLQAAAFATYRQACGENVRLEGYYHNTQLVAVALIQQLQTKLKHWLHVPHGPLVLAEHEAQFWPWWLQHYQALGRQLKLDLVRVSPLLPTGSEAFNGSDFKPAAIHLVNPERSWVLDITQSEEELLQQMKKSTRYEVRKGLKPEVASK